MKNKKLFLPTIIFAVAIAMTLILLLVSSVALKPNITEYEFPFSITYELDGETVTINDVYKAYYTKDLTYKQRMYDGEIGNNGENNTNYVIKKGDTYRIELSTNFYPDYLMGDPEYNDYYVDEPFEPIIYYYNAEGAEFSDEETLAKHEAKIVSFEYPEPIENSLSFSHFVFPESEVIFPSIIIAFVAWIVTLIFVKKDKEYIRKPINIITIVFNFIVGLVVLPFFTIIAGLLSALGDIGNIMNLLQYLLPALTLLGITASIGLRRKLYCKSALIVQFISPAIFAVIMIISSCLGLM